MRFLLDEELEVLLRECTPRVLAAVSRRFSDFADAEDAVQEALLAAAGTWHREGLPENPQGWLYRVACRRLIDQRRQDAARRKREGAIAPTLIEGGALPESEPEDTLLLLFMCCHPSLSPASAIPLTLRAIAGLTTAEIARAFMVPESTMAQRISRAKQSIRSSGIPFTPPTGGERNERLSSVLHTLYLLFSEGYASSVGTALQRPELAGEAIRLARLLLFLLPGNSEVIGLLSLMLLTHARRTARTGPQGELIPLTEQDRQKWDRDEIAEGGKLLGMALANGTVGQYQLQAAIAAVHDNAQTAEDTDWSQIRAFYDLLGSLSESPMIRLNRAVAVGMVHGPAAGLKELEELEASGLLAGHYRLDSVRANLLELSCEFEAAIPVYRAAAEKATNTSERDYLLARAARITGPIRK
jgi:RNA polymerase sigma factor (sigma-70 family)